jgi:hypothetical protein
MPPRTDKEGITYGITQKLQHTRKMVDSAHNEAIRFLNGLENVSAKAVTRLHTINGQPASQAVEDLASLVCNMVHAAHQTALQVCATKTTPNEGGKHCMPRPMSKKRHNLSVKLGVINQRDSRLAGLSLGSATTLEEVRQRNKPNKSLCHFIATFNVFL